MNFKTGYNEAIVTRSKWPHWLKGGIIGSGLAVVSGILMFSCLLLMTSSSLEGDSAGFACLPFVLINPMILFERILAILPFEIHSETTLFLGDVFFWFIAGSAFGGIVDIVKYARGKFG